MAKKKVILDCDPGHDDAIALMLAIYDPTIEILGITTIGGNQTVEKTGHNALCLLDYFDQNIPVAFGADRPLRKAPRICPEIHGNTGLDGFPYKEITLKKDDRFGPDLIIDLCLTNKDVIIVSTGPSTNIALALKKEPLIKSHISKIVLMGGSTGPGNITPFAEFNILVDPEAAEIVFNSGLPVYMHGLNVTRQAIVKEQIMKRIWAINNKASKLFIDLMEVFNKNQKEFFGLKEGGPLHDPVTIVSLIDKKVLEYKKARVEIETGDNERNGETRCDFKDKKPNAYVATSINLERYWSVIEKTIRRASGKPKPFSYTLNDLTEIDSYGGIHFISVLSNDILRSGYDHADILEVSFLHHKIRVPLVPDFNYIDILSNGITTCNFGADYLNLLCNGELFAEKYGLVKRNNDPEGPFWLPGENVSFPLTFKVSLVKKRGYWKHYSLFTLKRHNERECYPSLTDEEFANFRPVGGSNIKPHCFYRGGSPINRMLGRNLILDNILEEKGIKTIVNLHDNEGMANRQTGFVETYYSKQDVVYIHQPVSFFSDKFNEGIAKSIRFLLSHPMPWYIHCLEGKDRTGYIVALIQTLLGVSLKEIKEDYMKTFTNYYPIKKDSPTYKVLSERIITCLKEAFRKKKLKDYELHSLAEDFFLRIGLNEKEIRSLIESLTYL